MHTSIGLHYIHRFIIINYHFSISSLHLRHFLRTTTLLHTHSTEWVRVLFFFFFFLLLTQCYTLIRCYIICTVVHTVINVFCHSMNIVVVLTFSCTGTIKCLIFRQIFEMSSSIKTLTISYHWFHTCGDLPHTKLVSKYVNTSDNIYHNFSTLLISAHLCTEILKDRKINNSSNNYISNITRFPLWNLFQILFFFLRSYCFKIL